MNAKTSASSVADVHRDASSGHMPESSRGVRVQDEERAEARGPRPSRGAAACGSSSSGACGRVVGLCDEINATEPIGERDAEERERRRSLTEREAPRDRDDRRDDRSDRRDHSHAPEREPLVEERDRHHADDAGDDPDDDVLLLSGRRPSRGRRPRRRAPPRARATGRRPRARARAVPRGRRRSRRCRT